MTSLTRPKKLYGQELRGLDIPTASVPKVPYVVQPLLIKGESLLIHGPQQCGKSTLSWNLARCIGTGQRFYGLEVEQGSVLYIETDVKMATALPRLKRIGAMPGVTFHFAPTINLLNPHPALVETFQYYQREVQPSVVIFNTLRKIYSGDSKDDETPKKLLDAVQHFFPQASSVFNHHDVKKKFSEKGQEVGAQEEGFAGSKAWLNDIGGSIHILPEAEVDGEPKRSRVFHNKNQAGLTLPPFHIVLQDGGNMMIDWPASYVQEQLNLQFPHALRVGQGAAEFDAWMAETWGGVSTRYRDMRSKMGLHFPKGGVK